MTRPPGEVVKYGPVDLIIEPDRHVYVSRMTGIRIALAVILPIGLGLGGWAISFLIQVSRNPQLQNVWVSTILFILFGGTTLALLLLLWSTLAWKVRVELSPTGIVFTRRGLSLLGGRAGRSGRWRWRLQDLTGIDVDTLPFRDRAGWFVRSGIELDIAGVDRPIKTFFVFDSPQEAERFRDDLVASVLEMARKQEGGLLPEIQR